METLGQAAQPRRGAILQEAGREHGHSLDRIGELLWAGRRRVEGPRCRRRKEVPGQVFGGLAGPGHLGGSGKGEGCAVRAAEGPEPGAGTAMRSSASRLPCPGKGSPPPGARVSPGWVPARHPLPSSAVTPGASPGPAAGLLDPSVNQACKREFRVCFLGVKPTAGSRPRAKGSRRRAVGVHHAGGVRSLMSPSGRGPSGCHRCKFLRSAVGRPSTALPVAPFPLTSQGHEPQLEFFTLVRHQAGFSARDLNTTCLPLAVRVA